MQQDQEQDDSQADGWRERRIDRRLPITLEAKLSFLVRTLELHGRLQNLSLGGAQFVATAACPHGAGHLVEISFRLSGRHFRLTAVVQWNDGGRLGLRYEPLNGRRRQELQEAMVLDSIRAESEGEPDGQQNSRAETARPASQPTAAPPATQSQPAPAKAPSGRERRTHRRVGAQLPASIYMINSNVKLNGQVEDLSLGGCRIRTEHRVQVGIYTRIEAGFYHMGMPFRVAGVIQALHGTHAVGIRFLDVSERNRAKLLDLIKELAGGEE